MSVAYFSLSFAYVCIWRIMLIYVQKFAVDIRPVKVIKIPINPAVSGLAGGAELQIRWVSVVLWT